VRGRGEMVDVSEIVREDGNNANEGGRGEMVDMNESEAEERPTMQVRVRQRRGK